MSLQDLGALGELVGAVAVVLTLLYVAAQIRQNTRSLRSATSFAVNQALAEINGRWVSNPDGFTDLWLRGCADLDSLTPLERERFSRQAYDLLNLAVLQYEAERNDIGDVHIDYIGYLSRRVESRASEVRRRARRAVLRLRGPLLPHCRGPPRHGPGREPAQRSPETLTPAHRRLTCPTIPSP